jgi:hypothetical protein
MDVLCYNSVWVWAHDCSQNWSLSLWLHTNSEPLKVGRCQDASYGRTQQVLLLPRNKCRNCLKILHWFCIKQLRVLDFNVNRHTTEFIFNLQFKSQWCLWLLNTHNSVIHTNSCPSAPAYETGLEVIIQNEMCYLVPCSVIMFVQMETFTCLKAGICRSLCWQNWAII